MLKLDLPEERWLSLSEQPALLAASTGAGWQGFEFQETQVPHEGEFDNSSINLRFVWISGPVQGSSARQKKQFLNLRTVDADNSWRTDSNIWP